jgi:hypothetical protein
MIGNDRELQTTLERITWFQQQIAHLRKTETSPVNYRAATSGFLAEIDRMQLDVREYFCHLPDENAADAEPVSTADGERASTSGKGDASI